jgi:hypothetical protein
MRAARCSGHSATVRTIDWSVDSSVLQSNCAAKEILYWNPRTGELAEHCSLAIDIVKAPAAQCATMF